MGEKNSLNLKATSKIFYALTDNKIRLPVLDITNPLFLSSINEKNLNELEKEDIKQKNFRKNPIINFLAKRSLTLGKFLPKEKDASYLSGMATLMMKLGPKLIGGGISRFFDRKVAEGFVPMVVRMRLRDICQVQTEILAPVLKERPEKDLCIINIAGGAASESINALILLLKQDPELLVNSTIEIDVLDIDTFGPNFAKDSVESLKGDGGPFHGLDISIRHISYGWSDTSKLILLMQERKNWTKICTSEGGLFEYGTDEDIVKNLKVLNDYSTDDDMKIVGDVILDIEKVDPAFPAMLAGANNRIRFIGVEGLRKIVGQTEWTPYRVVEGNPVYTIFVLKKTSLRDTL